MQLIEYNFNQVDAADLQDIIRSCNILIDSGSMRKIWKEVTWRIHPSKTIMPRLSINMKQWWRIQHLSETPKDLEEAKKQLKKAWEEFCQVKESASELREHFSDTLIEEAEDAEDETKAKD